MQLYQKKKSKSAIIYDKGTTLEYFFSLTIQVFLRTIRKLLNLLVKMFLCLQNVSDGSESQIYYSSLSWCKKLYYYWTIICKSRHRFENIIRRFTSITFCTNAEMDNKFEKISNYMCRCCVNVRYWLVSFN